MNSCAWVGFVTEAHFVLSLNQRRQAEIVQVLSLTLNSVTSSQKRDLALTVLISFYGEFFFFFLHVDTLINELCRV